MFRGALVGLIYNRTLVLQDGLYDESAAVTLMSTDIDRIALSMELLHETWPHLLEVIVGVTLLARQLGWGCVFPLVVVHRKFVVHAFEGTLLIFSLFRRKLSNREHDR